MFTLHGTEVDFSFSDEIFDVPCHTKIALVWNKSSDGQAVFQEERDPKKS